MTIPVPNEFIAFIRSQASSLSPASFEFAQRIFADGIAKYVARLRQYKFEGMSSILDAGCGFGQWSLALADLNDKVEAVDIDQERIRVLNSLTKAFDVTNIRSHCCSLLELPYKDASFDAIFCYGVIFLTPWRKGLAELSRVLRSGGKLYVCVSGLGYYVNLWMTEKHKSEYYLPRKIVAEVFANTWRYDRDGQFTKGAPLIIEPEALEQALQNIGFTNIVREAEGKFQDQTYNGELTEPFYPGDYGGLTGVYEIIAEKR